MLELIRIAALAAMLSLVPAASVSLPTIPVGIEAAAATPDAQAKPAPAPMPAPQPEFGLDTGHQHASGLAPGQTAEDFKTWLRSAPENRAGLTEFGDYLEAAGVATVVPMWQLVRTSSSWRECGAEPFEAPPADKWEHIVNTLKFVRDQVEPQIGKVEALSAYRNDALNACSNGAPQSAHRHFFALDLTPVNAAVARSDMVRSVCAAHAREGRAYKAGLGFYTGRRFHVDSNGYRKWGPNGRSATSPCVSYA